MFNAILPIAAGGALGSVARYAVNVCAGKIAGTDFPYGTLGVNIVGSFIMGVLVALFAHIWQPSESLKLFLLTGFLGGFTTFSSFSLDVVTLLERQEYAVAAIYLVSSVVLSVGGLFAGMILVREFMA